MTETADRLRALLEERVSAARAATVPGIEPRPDRSVPAPLSPVQARLWFLAALEPDSPAYNVPFVLRMRGRVDTDALLGAVRDLVDREEVLRCVVAEGPDGPVAAPRPADEVPIDATDLSTEPDPGAELERRLDQEATTPFDLSRECPTRARYFRVAEDKHVLAVTVHHLAADAWSYGLIVDDLATLYAARLGVADPPPPRPIGYGDVAVWERDRDHDDSATLDWWAERLRGLPPVLDLPTDRPRRETTTWPGDTVPIEIPADLVERIRAAGRDTGATPFMVLLAALRALLYRVGAGTDIPIGVPEAGRRHRDTESVIGCFVNTLVLRGDLSGRPTGRELLRRAREDALEAFAHAEAPFERVVDRVGAPRIVGSTPLYQVTLNLVDEKTSSTRFPGLDVAVADRFTGVAKCDLSVALGASGAGLNGVLAYRADLFDPATARRLVRWYLTVLEAILTDPDRPVADIDLEPAPEPIRGPDLDVPALPLHALIERWAERTPDALAVTGYDGRLTYAELDRWANRIAHRLVGAGAGPDEPVAVLAERGIGLVAGFLGALKAGCGYLPLDPAYPDDRLAGILTTAGTRFVIAGPGLGGRVDAERVITVDDESEDVPETRPDVPVEPERLAYVIFTSGSTGAPKGVAVEHRHIVGYLSGVLGRFGLAVPDGNAWALMSTFAADLGITSVLGALVTGGLIRMVERETATDPEALAEFLRREPVDVYKCVPSHLELLAAHGDLADLLPGRLLILAGEPCPWSLVDRIERARPDLAVKVTYGPSETTVSALIHDAGTDGRYGDVVPLGRPLPGVALRVADADGRPVPAGLPGDLVIGGDTVARGYLGRPDLTAERFGADPEGVRWYRSGDRVRVRPDGIVEFLGRIDDQVKIRGFRVEPLEVAAVLRDCPGVAEAVVLPIGEGHRRRLAGWLVAEPGADLDPAAVRASARDRLPDYMVPQALRVLDELPLNPNGKVDRAALPAPEERVGGRAPETPTEIRIAEIWRDLLGVTEVSADDEFFALGGDSFRALRAVRDLDPNLRVIELFTHPTVAELAAFYDQHDQDDTGGLVHQLAGPPATRTPTVTIVCVPFGGGSAAAYQPLARELTATNPGARVLAVELPGHDPARPDEPPLSIEEVVDRCSAELAEVGPVLVYGHCVGTALAAALARRLEDDGRDVVGLVVGGNFPSARLPGRISAFVNRHLPTDRWMSDRAYRDVLRVAGSMFDDEDENTVETMMRALRHDARGAEAWFSEELTNPGRPLSCPVLVVIGERDRATELYQERYTEWAAIGPRVELATIPRAGHYFLKHQAARLAELVLGRVEAWTAGRVPPRRRPAAATQRGALRAFYLVAAGQLVSMTGTALSSFALGVWAFQESGRALDYALVTMLAFLPAILVAPVGGAVADRFDRRSVMLVCDGASGVSMAVLVALLATGRLAFWHVCLIVWFTSLIAAFHRPAYMAAIAQLVPKPYLPQANALAQLGLGVGTLIAPLAGGALITLVGLPTVIAVDVVSFAVGLVTLLAVRFPNRLFRKREETFRSAIVGGWRFIIRRRALVVMIVFFVVENYFGLLPEAVLAPMMLEIGDPAALGIVTAAGGLGAAVGVIVMVVWGGTDRRATGMVGFVIPIGVGVALMGIRPSVPLVAVGLFLTWMATAVLNAHWLAIIQVKVGSELQGRVLATNQMLAVAMTPLSFLTGPILAESLFGPLVSDHGALAGTLGRVTGGGDASGIAALLVVAGLLLTVWGVIGLRYRPLRYMEDDLPDNLLGAEVANLDELQAEADRVLVPTGRS